MIDFLFIKMKSQNSERGLSFVNRYNFVFVSTMKRFFHFVVFMNVVDCLRTHPEMVIGNEIKFDSGQCAEWNGVNVPSKGKGESNFDPSEDDGYIGVI